VRSWWAMRGLAFAPAFRAFLESSSEPSLPSPAALLGQMSGESHATPLSPKASLPHAVFSRAEFAPIGVENTSQIGPPLPNFPAILRTMKPRRSDPLLPLADDRCPVGNSVAKRRPADHLSRRPQTKTPARGRGCGSVLVKNFGPEFPPGRELLETTGCVSDALRKAA
jgi:hypothetical protein